MRCGLIWPCAPCSRKVSAGRAREVLGAIDGCRAAGGSVALLTLTFPHTRHDNLGELRESLTRAWDSLNRRRGWRRAREAASLHGTIRSLEITWGAANGWHPHLHVLLFSDRVLNDADLESVRSATYREWLAGCRTAGLPLPSERHGVDVRRGEDAAGYVAKWGLEAEVVLSALKKGRGDRYTPWELLAQLDQTGNVVWRDRWIEYVEATRGARQLVWSHGLKARYGVDELDDQVLAEKGGDEDERLWLLISRGDWSLVYRANRIADVLRLAAAGDRAGLFSLLAGVIPDSIL